MIDLFFYNIFVIAITFLMLIIGQETLPFTIEFLREKECFCAMFLLKNNLQEYSVVNNWELLVLFFRFYYKHGQKVWA